MINERILLEKRRFTGFVRSTGSVEKAIKLVVSFCVMLALLIGCGEPDLNDPKVREKVLAQAIDENNLQTRSTPSGEKLPYAPNQKRPYAGWVKSGRELGQFQNGKPNGLYISWFGNNQNYQKGIFMDGKKNGLWIEWYENGQKSEEGPYKDNNRDGTWFFWYENGQKNSEGPYTSGSKNGLWTEWYTDGTEKSKGNWKEGSKEGAWVFSYDNGQKSSEGAYINGSKDGSWTEWYENGQKSNEGTYKSGRQDGSWTEWYIDGTEKSKGNWKEGSKEGAWVFSYDNGQKSSEGAYINGSKDGSWTEWYENGQKSNEGTYKSGRQDGSWTEWYTDGTEKSKGNWKEDYRIGPWTWWHDNATKEAEGTFKGGKDWSYVYFDRDPERSIGDGRTWRFVSRSQYFYFPGTWIEGIADGKWIFWHANGKKWAEGHYKDGNGVRRWIWWHSNGQKAAEGTFRYVNRSGITEFGVDDSYSDRWGSTLFTVSGRAWGKWIFWHKNGQKNLELTIEQGSRPNTYRLVNSDLWNVEGRRLTIGFSSDIVSARYKTGVKKDKRGP